jgi:hypothetical protein
VASKKDFSLKMTHGYSILMYILLTLAAPTPIFMLKWGMGLSFQKRANLKDTAGSFGLIHLGITSLPYLVRI